MSHQVRLLAALASGLALWVSGAPGTAAEAPAVSFAKDIAPILQKKCVTCHGPERIKGGFQLHTFEALNKPGDSKEAALTPGQPAQSKLYRLLLASDPDDRMPQKDDPLPAPQVALIERWIREGARFDGADPTSSLASLLPPTVHPEPPDTYPHPTPVSALAFSPDGGTLAVGGYHEVTLWNPSDGSLLRRIRNIDQQTLALAFSPDGSSLAVAGGTPGRSGEAKLIQLRAGGGSRMLVRIGDLLLTLAFRPDGQKLALGGADNLIRIIDVGSGREDRRIEQHADWVTSLAYSPQGDRLASVSRDKTARLLDTETGELEETYAGHTQPLFGVGFAPGGKRLISGGRDKSLHVWQAKEAKKSLEIAGFDSGVWRILVQSNEVFTCSSDRLVRQHRLAEKKAELIRTYTGHGDVVYALAYHAPSQRLASAGYDGEVRIWSTKDGMSLRRFVAAPGYQSGKAESGQ